MMTMMLYIIRSRAIEQRQFQYKDDDHDRYNDEANSGDDDHDELPGEDDYKSICGDDRDDEEENIDKTLPK